MTRVAGGLFSPGFGFGLVLCGLLFLFALDSGCLEAEAVIAGFEDVAVMGSVGRAMQWSSWHRRTRWPIR